MRASDPGALSQEIVSCLTLGTGESSARGICAILSEPCVEDNKARSSVAIHFLYYNFGRIHKTLRITPAMAAGLIDHVWSLEEIALLAN
jgi:hypothetical protein